MEEIEDLKERLKSIVQDWNEDEYIEILSKILEHGDINELDIYEEMFIEALSMNCTNLLNLGIELPYRYIVYNLTELFKSNGINSYKDIINNKDIITERISILTNERCDNKFSIPVFVYAPVILNRLGAYTSKDILMWKSRSIYYTLEDMLLAGGVNRERFLSLIDWTDKVLVSRTLILLINHIHQNPTDTYVYNDGYYYHGVIFDEHIVIELLDRLCRGSDLKSYIKTLD